MVATPHPLPYWFASGLSFFPGLLLIAAAACIPLGRLPRRRLAARAATAGAGAALAILSAAPLPPWACGLGGAVVAAMAVGTDPLGRSHRAAAVALRLAAVGACLMALAVELPCHRFPALPLGEGETLCVIGDSLASEPGARTWPALLGARHDVDVVDLTAGGATVNDARRQAAALAGRGLIVLVVGAGDRRAGRSAEDFAADLDALVATINARGPCRVIVVELPLSRRYGLAQRRAIRALPNRALLPRRVLAGLLAADGAGLSPDGHGKMAEAIWRAIEPR
ncbi:MAG: hypothetical protein GX591_14360 [Planctomycetes bacterium]|nr:hypothetical protein [Planctomycetota bacterium]